jgi:hypothetical protein
MGQYGQHCGVPLHRVVKLDVIHPGPDYVQQYQVLRVAKTHCAICKQDVWQYSGTGYDGKQSRFYEIKPRHVAEWIAAIRQRAIDTGVRGKIHVSEYTVDIAKDPADIFEKILYPERFARRDHKKRVCEPSYPPLGQSASG